MGCYLGEERMGNKSGEERGGGNTKRPTEMLFRSQLAELKVHAVLLYRHNHPANLKMQSSAQKFPVPLQAAISN